MVTAAKLADFLSSLEAEEVLLEQRRRDEEGRLVFALMEGTAGSDLPAGAGLPTPLDHIRAEQQEHPERDLPATSGSQASQAQTSHQEEDPDAIYEDY